MWVIVVCILLVLAGLLAVVRWGGLAVRPPPTPPPHAAGSTDPPPMSLVARRYLWYLALAVTAGFGAGILAAGAGGRLAMRLLAVTAGADAQGRITEAQQVVGRITVDGTLGFIVFTALFFGLASGAIYLLLHRLLPTGWAGGLAYGALLLVVAGTRLEPLRRGNPDFDLVGPGWVSVAVFAALVVFHGVLVAALAGRLSRTLPLLSLEPRALAGHALLLLLVLLAPLGAHRGRRRRGGGPGEPGSRDGRARWPPDGGRPRGPGPGRPGGPARLRGGHRRHPGPRPLMLVPTKCPPYDDNLTRSIQLDTTYLGLALDPEGRHHGRYDP
jgi:hypothetical protein